MFKILIAFSTLALAACTSMNIDLPVARFDLPETNGMGEQRGQVSLQVEPTQNFESTPDASSRPPDLTRPNIKHMVAGGAHASISFLERLDVGIKSTFGHSPTLLSVKYQLFGNSLASPEVNSWSLAVSGAFGYSDITQKGSQNGILGPGGFNWEGHLHTIATDAAVIVGNRLSETILLYSSVYYANYSLETKINDSVSDSGTSPAAEYKVTNGGNQRGANLGIAINVGPRSMVKLETAYSDLNISPTSDWFWTYGASYGVRF